MFVGALDAGGSGLGLARLLAAAVGFLAALVAGVWLMLFLCLEADPSQAALRRAAAAVIARANARSQAVVVARGGRRIAVPPLSFDRRTAVLLALEGESLRKQAEEALARARREEAEASGRATLEALAAFVFARGRLSAFLKVEPDRAGIVLCALGWPWMSESWLESGPSDPAGGLSQRQWQDALQAAERAVAWPAGQAHLTQELHLSPEQAEAVRAALCRQAVEGAFLSRRGVRTAREALAKYASLTSAQSEAVLAMAGALALLRAGELRAADYLDMVARREPEVAAVLREAMSAPPRIGGAEP